MAIDLPEALKSVTNYPESYLKTAELDGDRWAAVSDKALTGIVGTHGHGIVRDACSTEMQRRMVASVVAFSADASAQTAKLIALSGETSKQTDKLIVLTYWIVGLTVALGIIAALKLWAMLNGVA